MRFHGCCELSVGVSWGIELGSCNSLERRFVAVFIRPMPSLTGDILSIECIACWLCLSVPGSASWIQGLYDEVVMRAGLMLPVKCFDSWMTRTLLVTLRRGIKTSKGHSWHRGRWTDLISAVQASWKWYSDPDTVHNAMLVH